MSRQQLAVMLDDSSEGEASLGKTVQVGMLSCDRSGSREAVSFSYAPEWLHSPRAFAIDPELQLGAGAYHPGRDRSLFGIFRDTAPDRWGRVLMERREAIEAEKEKRKAQRLSDWDFLIGVSDFTRMGALRLKEIDGEQHYIDSRERSAPPMARLRELEAVARELSKQGAEDRPEYEQWLRQLFAPGSSLGGARPKASFSTEEGALWMAKFPASDDRRDVGAWEFLAHRLAADAGIAVPASQLLAFNGPYRTFAVQRFDRLPGTRRLYASAMTLLGRTDGEQGSYVEIAQTIQDQGDPAGLNDDLAELYRRVLFSVLIGNRDDHFRNHGFLRTAGGWRLAPAFDINPNPDKAEHALAIDESDPRPSVAHLRATHAYYRLSALQAQRIEAEVRASVDRWRLLADELKLSRSVQSQLETVIDPGVE